MYGLQFGFRDKFCTIHVFINITDNIKQACLMGKLVMKYFQIYKKPLIQWTIIFLQQNFHITGSNYIYLNREQYVSINNFKSKLASISYGVPQVSVLETLFFLPFINDLLHVIKIAKFIILQMIQISHTLVILFNKHIITMILNVWLIGLKVTSAKKR